MYFADNQNYPSQGLSGLEITLRPVSCTVFPRALYCTSWDAGGTAEASVVMSVTTQAPHLQSCCPLLHRPLQVEDISDVSAVCWALSRVEDKQPKCSTGELMGDMWLAPNEQVIQWDDLGKSYK